MWSNADEVKAFIEDHKAGRWAVGDRFVLPDIEQAYEVVAVRPFKHRGKFKLFVDLDAQCAVTDCENYFIATKEVHQWMSSPHLVRCCEAHRGGFSTPMRDAWKTQEQIAARPVRVERKATPPRTGPNERAVLDAIEDLGVVSDRLPVASVIDHAISLLPEAPAGRRDTRRQRVVRSLTSLAGVGRVAVRGGDVLL